MSESRYAEHPRPDAMVCRECSSDHMTVLVTDDKRADHDAWHAEVEDVLDRDIEDELPGFIEDIDP